MYTPPSSSPSHVTSISTNFLWPLRRSNMLAEVSADIRARAEQAAALGKYAEADELVGYLGRKEVRAALKAGREDIFAVASIWQIRDAAKELALTPAQYAKLFVASSGEEMWNVLQSAVQEGHAAAVRGLLGAGKFEVDKMLKLPRTSKSQGDWRARGTLLYQAVSRGHAQVVEALLAHGADPSRVRVDHFDLYPCVPIRRVHSAAGTAVKFGHPEPLATLLKALPVPEKRLRGYLTDLKVSSEVRFRRLRWDEWWPGYVDDAVMDSANTAGERDADLKRVLREALSCNAVHESRGRAGSSR